MYRTESYQIQTQQKLTLKNPDSGINATVLPGCGGMLVSLKLEEEEYLYTDVASLFSKERPKCGMPVLFSFGFHPYFQVSELELVEFGITAGEMWIPSKNIRCVAPDKFSFSMDGAQEYGAMFSQAVQKASFWDRGNGHRLEVSFSAEFPYLLIWSRPDKHFACVEPWSAPADAFNTARETLSSLDPGQEMTACMGLHILESTSKQTGNERRKIL